jgi:hypothetical protein
MRVTNKKIIFAATIAGVTLFTIYKATKDKRAYSEVPTASEVDSETKPVKEEKVNKCEEIKKDVKKKVEKVKLSIKRRVEKILAFLVAHADEIDAIRQTVTLVASLFTLRSVMQKSKMGLPNIEMPRKTPLLETSDATYKSFDVKNGDVLVGEWDNAGQYLHFSVV